MRWLYSTGSHEAAAREAYAVLVEDPTGQGLACLAA